MRSFDVLIVGAGHGGSHAAIALRQRGLRGSIGIVGAEPKLPYERPPLSKDLLAGEKSFERILIRPAAFWPERQIEVLTGRLVTSVIADDHAVLTSTGERFGYGKLIWAAGGEARPLGCPGANLTGVHTLRSHADVERLLGELPAARQVVVVGGGYIGLETAAVLSKLGKSVTVVEALSRILARVAGETVSRFYEGEHRSHGVELRLDSVVESIEGDHRGRATGVRLADGEVIPAEMVVVGIGIAPCIEPLRAAGAVARNGVRVDSSCRTSLPDIFAIGDCALHANEFAAGREIRLESVQNATDMATTVARTLTGDEQRYHAVPWFWSNQYDLRLQTVGLSMGFDQEIVRGTVASRSFSVIYLRERRVIALDCVNVTRDYIQGRALVAHGARIPIEQLMDSSLPLKGGPSVEKGTG